MIATKNAHDWSCEAHGTYGWRGESCRQCPEAPSEIAELKRQLEEAGSEARRQMQHVDTVLKQLAESQAREVKLREFSLDQWWYSELKSLLDLPEITDDAKRVIIGVIPNLIGQIQALPHDDTALKEYRDAVIEECIATAMVAGVDGAINIANDLREMKGAA